MIDATNSGDVVVLTMNAEENRFNGPMLDAFKQALDNVEASDTAAAVVLTGTGKFFSNGLDLEWMTEAGEESTRLVVEGLQALYMRLLAFPVPVIAAVNGHAFAGGAMLALACDERVMREDRGYFCLPEVDINIPFVSGMSKLIQAKLTPAAAHKAMLSGHRFGGPEALQWGIVDELAAEDQVLPTAIERTKPFSGKNRDVASTIKNVMYEDAIEALARLESF
jgi:enoyl-CoA hydratase/carnithine racemase